MAIFLLTVDREARQSPAVRGRAEDGPSTPRSRGWGGLDMTSTDDFGTSGFYSMWPSRSFLHCEDILIRAGDMAIFLFPLHCSACSRRQRATLHR